MKIVGIGIGIGAGFVKSVRNGLINDFKEAAAKLHHFRVFKENHSTHEVEIHSFTPNEKGVSYKAKVSEKTMNKVLKLLEKDNKRCLEKAESLTDEIILSKMFGGK